MRTLLLIIGLMVALRGTAQDSAAVHNRPGMAFLRSSIVPVVLIGYGIACAGSGGFPSSRSVKAWRDERFPSFRYYADDYLLYSNAVLVYGFRLAGVKSRSDLLNQSAILAKTSLVTLGITGVIKYTTGIKRPDGSNNYSFPSGHTSLAFAYATVLHKEFAETSPWISVLGYSTAIATGSLRILNNKHWFSDVLAGAGIGILSTNLVYLTHQYKFGAQKRKNSGCLPIIGNGYYGLLWHKTF